jgi:hypothetical protein
MSLLPVHRPPGSSHDDAEALIREARRRQRRRQLAIGAAIVVLAGLTGTITALTAPGASHHRAADARRKAVSKAIPQPASPGPIPHSVATTLLLWPADGTTWGPSGGPTAYADDLTTGRLAQTSKAAIGGGDYQPVLVRTGDWLVYVGNGTNVIRTSLTGGTRTLASTPFFIPAAQPGYVWLPGAKNTIRLAAAAGGPPGQPIALPPGSQPIAGTDAGLLLIASSGLLELWRPGSVPRSLPGSAASGLTDGFGVSPRLVAYGVGCVDVGISANAPYEADGAYQACRTLRVLDVLTGRLTSFPAPRGTTGWVPYQFDTTSPISPGGAMIAAEAAVRSRYDDQGRLYVIPIGQKRGQLRVVPGSAGFVRSKVAWSVHGGWLFFQGPTGNLWAYQPGSGDVRASATPCCQYNVMIALPSPEQ